MKPALLSLSALALVGSLSAQNIVGVNWAGDAVLIDPASGTESPLGPTGFTGLNSLANVDGNLITIDDNGALITIDSLTGAGTQLIMTNPVLDNVRGLASNAAGELYAIVNGGGTAVVDKLYRIEVGTGMATSIGDTTPYTGLQGLTFTQTGTLLSWDVGTGSGFGAGLVSIDVTTGTATDISASVGNVAELQCLSTNPQTGQVFGGNEVMYTVNVFTGQVTEVAGSELTDVRGMELFLRPATCTERNGTGVNPMACTCVSVPSFGTTWQVNVTSDTNTVATFLLISVVPLDPGIVVPFIGEVMVIDPISISEPSGNYSLAIPNDPTLLDFPLTGQGLRLNDNGGNFGLQLTNAVDGVLGY